MKRFLNLFDTFLHSGGNPTCSCHCGHFVAQEGFKVIEFGIHAMALEQDLDCRLDINAYSNIFRAYCLNYSTVDTVESVDSLRYHVDSFGLYGATQEREPMTEEALAKQMKAAFRASWAALHAIYFPTIKEATVDGFYGVIPPNLLGDYVFIVFYCNPYISYIV